MLKKNIEDIYPLSELQEHLLVHRQRAVRGARGRDSGSLLLHGTLSGYLDRERFERAWCETVQEHQALRTSVHWEGVRRPIQVVAREVDVAVEFEDWCDVSQAERADRWRETLVEARAAGLDLARSPVLRFGLVKAGPEEHLWFWACHHILLDGWSSALVLDELLQRYRATAGEPFVAPARRPFKEYVTWLAERPELGAEEVLEHLEPTALLSTPYLSGADFRGDLAVDGHAEREVEGASQGALDRWARSERSTVSALFLGAWGLVLAEATATDRPALGFTTSGRTAEFEGLESMIGMFANTLPLQLTLDRAKTVSGWFNEVFRAQQGLQRLESCSLVRLMEAGGVALRRAPFDTLVAYANFPMAAKSVDPEDPGQLAIGEFHGDITSGYPLTLAIKPPLRSEGPLRIEAHYATALFSSDEVDALLARFDALILETLKQEVTTLGEILEKAPCALDHTFADRAERRSVVVEAVRPLGGTGAAAPETATEAQLMRIWNDLVDVQEYGVDDNFFDLGGHSLLVPQMIERVSQDFGVELPLGAIVEAPTVRGLSRAIDGASEGERSATDWPSLVRVRGGGREAPLFMVHGLGGEVGWFYNLANYLDPSIPLFGLQAPPAPFDDVPKMAAHYVREMRSAQSSGPYRIGGYCVGGGVAYEMAQQLQEVGESVEVLVLIDSVPQAHAFGGGSLSSQLGGRLRRLASKEPREILSSVADAARKATRRVAKRAVAGSVRDRSATGGGPAPMELADVLDLRTLPQVYHHASEQHFRAMRDYVPQPYRGDVWLFRTGNPQFGHDFGWAPLIQGELHVEQVEGRHIDVLKEPHVRGLGGKLSQVIESVAPRQRS